MDARSVMEQRLQAMVCCFSMVQRVLVRQPGTQQKTHNKYATNANSSTVSADPVDGNTNSESEGLLPTRTVTGAEASERIWRYLSAVPTLMEVRALSLPPASRYYSITYYSVILLYLNISLSVSLCLSLSLSLSFFLFSSM